MSMNWKQVKGEILLEQDYQSDSVEQQQNLNRNRHYSEQLIGINVRIEFFCDALEYNGILDGTDNFRNRCSEDKEVEEW